MAVDSSGATARNRNSCIDIPQFDIVKTTGILALVALREKPRPDEADTSMEKQKIAIACQGGGSQTAFTAGVLSAFFENRVHLQKQIVSLVAPRASSSPRGVVWTVESRCR